MTVSSAIKNINQTCESLYMTESSIATVKHVVKLFAIVTLDALL